MPRFSSSRAPGAGCRCRDIYCNDLHYDCVVGMTPKVAKVTIYIQSVALKFTWYPVSRHFEFSVLRKSCSYTLKVPSNAVMHDDAMQVWTPHGLIHVASRNYTRRIARKVGF